MTSYQHRFPVALHDTDAAGVLFYAHLFRHLHDAYEGMMAARGMPLAGIVAGRRLHLPLAHAEADYLAPLRHGDAVTVAVTVERVGEKSFALSYEVTTAAGVAARGRTVHVALDPNGGATPLPPELAAALGGREGEELSTDGTDGHR